MKILDSSTGARSFSPRNTFPHPSFPFGFLKLYDPHPFFRAGSAIRSSLFDPFFQEF